MANKLVRTGRTQTNVLGSPSNAPQDKQMLILQKLVDGLSTATTQEEVDLYNKKIKAVEAALELEQKHSQLAQAKEDKDLARNLKERREHRLAVRFYVSAATTVIAFLSGLGCLYLNNTEMAYFLLGGSSTAGAVGIVNKTSERKEED